MKELFPSGDAARLGFGCSALIGGRTRKEAVRLLEVAYAAGIDHFDVARVYGTGDAESVVGEFAASRRDQITITTKFGIDPMGRSVSVDLAKGVFRAAARRSRRLVGFARRHGGGTVERGLFSPEKARVSLAISLGELRTSVVDAFLLHDCSAAEWGDPALLEMLEGLRAEGSIRAYGPATSLEEVQSILTAPTPPPAVAQFAYNVATENSPVPGDMADTSTIIHGCFREALPRVRRALAADANRTRRWSAVLDVDVSSESELSALLLARTLDCNPGGVVLFSSGDPSRIERNASIALERPYERARLRELDRLLREDRA
jgi:diketogulonate reductase-like aldo/keto reductase